MRVPLPLVAALATTFILITVAHAQGFSNLGNFNGTDGERPQYGSVIQSTDGNYYGTAFYGGVNGNGVVFEATPDGTLNDIHDFCAPGCTDGANPNFGLILGTDGDLYGVTRDGGAHGSGTVFKMTNSGQVTGLYSFCAETDCSDGQTPYAPLMLASNGKFYGTVYQGGAHGYGTIFEMTPTGALRTLYSFCAKENCADGGNPYSGLTQGGDGNLYGTTAYYGSQNGGTVFGINAAGKLKTLYNFCSSPNCGDGQYPLGGLTQASNGNFYGTTNLGGAYGYGTVFELTSAGQLTTLHSFNYSDGGYPTSPPLQANDGNFYGTTSYGGGGLYEGGTIYEVTSAGTFTSLYSFCSVSACTGDVAQGALSQTTNGAFIGTTTFGPTGDGNVYTFSSGLAPLAKTVPTAAKPGARVVILGHDLTGSTSVTFNGTPAAFIVRSDSYITATVPAGATTGRVYVTTPKGTLKSSPVFQVLK